MKIENLTEIMGMIDEKKAAEKISTAFASPASLLDATLKRLIQPGLSFCRPDKTRQASHQA
ncbi:hypothetical protein ACVZD4_06120 [Escherichia coli]|uniref:hypothetical protein n=2 Tax=Escherichia coli TaxID=562 RepID=UPI0001E7003D|nr:hypothetical protein [Escherichia coli]EFQ02536.1 hypothetical protein EC182770_1249 [Escherichia coli 1827-70]EZA41926.1 hypothetical protein BW69_08690 [Escherichia coli O103:H11 str. 04-3023]KDT77462.1 hypothetical protein AB47_4255 [Escherichia coli 3-373-03_S1_C2]KDU34466.1 hypothetical protein AB77_4607 [Escherichia coli 3-373-03_S1_C3]EKO6922719.1 hypothetical protein [Escherichia coli]